MSMDLLNTLLSKNTYSVAEVTLLSLFSRIHCCYFESAVQSSVFLFSSKKGRGGRNVKEKMDLLDHSRRNLDRVCPPPFFQSINIYKSSSDFFFCLFISVSMYAPIWKTSGDKESLTTTRKDGKKLNPSQMQLYPFFTAILSHASP